MIFSQDEINLICIYDAKSRAELLNQLTLSTIRIENEELQNIVENIISKLEKMTDNEFTATEFIPTVTAEDLEV